MKKAVAKIKKLKPRVRKRKGSTSVVPAGRITNDTVAEHREQVLGRARKYIYPLQQSKHRLVVISVTLFLIALVVFFSYCVLALYKFKSNSTFLYKVTQVIPFPVARTGNDFVAYENYFFEINHYTHYYKTQQDLDLDSEAGMLQIAEFKKRALEKVINDAYIKEIANQKGIKVSNSEVNDEIAKVRNQNRLGSSDKEFRAVLRDFWGWSENDFKRSLKTQLLTEKVISALDTEAHDKANATAASLKNGEDFAAVAKEVSEEPISKAAGGDYGFVIELTNRDIDPSVTDALFKLKDGEVSGVIDVGYGLEIVKRVQTQGDGKVKASHIVFNYNDIGQYLNDMKDQKKARSYLRL